MNCTSADGTPIAFTRAGSGPPVVLVDRALSHRALGPNRGPAAELAKHCTVFTYDLLAAQTAVPVKIRPHLAAKPGYRGRGKRWRDPG